MNGKRAKRLRRMVEGMFVENEAEKQNNGKVRVGRSHGGPAFGHFPYPPSARWEKIGGFDVLVMDTDEIRKHAAQAVDTPTS